MRRARLLVLALVTACTGELTVADPASDAASDPARDAADETSPPDADAPPGAPDAAPLSRPPPGARFSAWVHPGDDGRLVYEKTAQGDRVPDFSYAGFGGGGVALPVAPVRRTLAPAASGDDGARIQAALDEVGALPLGGDGLRGAVLLKKGTYRIAGSLRLDRAGVVLRGEGVGTGGTVLVATGTSQRSLIVAGGTGKPTEVAGSRQRITDAYVPVGARDFHVADGSGFAPGQRVMVVRPSPQPWIDAIGMDACGATGTAYDDGDVNGETCLDNPWAPGSKDLAWDRVVTAVSGDLVTVDAPITTAIDTSFGAGVIYRFDFPGRIRQVGVEHLRGESTFASATDEAHSWRFVELVAVEDAWVRHIEGVHFAYAAVDVGPGSRRVTVEDSACLDPVSLVDGGRRYSFDIDDAQLVLVQRCHARHGRHDYVLGSTVPGPNVFLRSTAESTHADIGPHHRWSSGVLFDQIETTGELNVRNRGNMGSGHGWAGADTVTWNAKAGSMIVEDPPGAHNWAIGCTTADRTGDATWDSNDAPVWPDSLYLRQLEERRGPGALDAIGY